LSLAAIQRRAERKKCFVNIFSEIEDSTKSMSQLAPGAGFDNEADVKFKEIIRSLDFLLLFQRWNCVAHHDFK
jgi:hypothetical protein